MAPIGYPEAVITKYQSTLCNIPEERRPYLHGGGSLKNQETKNPYN
jgi:hypothetical protein